jgi:ABC-type antimicrobial peptide transport system permease subunit
MAVFVRTNQDPTVTVAAMANLIHSIDPEVSFTQRTMEESLRNHVLPVKVASSFFAIFGVMGLMLASVGLLGVMGFSVVRRTREIGIRMALGADRKKIVRKIIGEGLALTLVGIVIGVLAAVGLTRALPGFIFGINHLDPLSYGGTIGVMIAATLIACYFPARRASKVDPMIALRCE